MPETIHVVLADYGLNGASVLGVYASRPDEATLAALAAQPSADAPYSPRSVTGYSGLIVDEVEVQA